MTHIRKQLAIFASAALMASAGTAFAGDKKNCDHRKKTAAVEQSTEARSEAVAQTAVLPANAKMQSAAMTTTSTASSNFDTALQYCLDKNANAAMLQSCIDAKLAKVKSKPVG